MFASQVCDQTCCIPRSTIPWLYSQAFWLEMSIGSGQRDITAFAKRTARPVAGSAPLPQLPTPPAAPPAAPPEPAAPPLPLARPIAPPVAPAVPLMPPVPATPPVSVEPPVAPPLPWPARPPVAPLDPA